MSGCILNSITNISNNVNAKNEMLQAENEQLKEKLEKLNNININKELEYKYTELLEKYDTLNKKYVDILVVNDEQQIKMIELENRLNKLTVSSLSTLDTYFTNTIHELKQEKDKNHSIKNYYSRIRYRKAPTTLHKNEPFNFDFNKFNLSNNNKVSDL